MWRLSAVLLCAGAVVFATPTVAQFPDPDDPVFEDTDSDGDTLTDRYEHVTGSHPWSMDTDGDGLSDGDEVRGYHTHPQLYDTDQDGVSDYDELVAGTDPNGPIPVEPSPPDTGGGGGGESGGGGGVPDYIIENPLCAIFDPDLCFLDPIMQEEDRQD